MSTADLLLTGALRGTDVTAIGTDGHDTIAAEAGVNFLRGGAGDDSVLGGLGFDNINGNMGADTLRGGAGDDWVVGGKDNDLLFGANITNALTRWQAAFPITTVGDKDANVLQGMGPGGTPTKLFFDTETGMLLRAVRFVTTACALARAGEVDGIVTAPLNKAAMHAAGVLHHVLNTIHAIGNSPKLKLPELNVAISGRSSVTTRAPCSAGGTASSTSIRSCITTAPTCRSYRLSYRWDS